MVKIGEYSLNKTENKAGSSLRLEMSKPGQAKPYIVSYNPNAYGDSKHEGWACSCPGWIYKRGEVRKCKHLDMIASEMSNLKSVVRMPQAA